MQLTYQQWRRKSDADQQALRHKAAELLIHLEHL
jgi:deoxyribodipyrimidine photolyase-related protein